MADAPIVGILGMTRQQSMLGYAVFEFAERDLLVLGADRNLDAFILLDELIMVTVQPFGVNSDRANFP